MRRAIATVIALALCGCGSTSNEPTIKDAASVLEATLLRRLGTDACLEPVLTHGDPNLLSETRHIHLASGVTLQLVGSIKLRYLGLKRLPSGIVMNIFRHTDTKKTNFKAILSLSDPGFSKISQHGVVHQYSFVASSYVCGGLCGDGELFTYERVGGDWKLVGRQETWVS